MFDNFNCTDFESLVYESGPEKALSRMQLLVTPACKSPVGKKISLVWQLRKELFEVIEDHGHEGCGWISRALYVYQQLCEIVTVYADISHCYLCWYFSLLELIGSSSSSKAEAAKYATAIQVRLYSPTKFGIAKGMLMVKDDLRGIQVPTSMCKVNKSLVENPLHDSVAIAVKAIFPSKPCHIIGRLFDSRRRVPTPNQLKEINSISETFGDILRARGVNSEVLDRCKLCLFNLRLS